MRAKNCFPINRMLALVVFFISLTCLNGCHSPNKPLMQQQRKQKAKNAYNHAKEAILREKTLTIDLIWVLQELLKEQYDDEIAGFVAKQSANYKEHHSLLLINSQAERFVLPEALPSGIERYTTYLRSPFGKPQERAIKYITEFVEPDQSGYILTHQFLVLEWSGQTGLELPQELQKRKLELLPKIYQEQLTDDSFFDLYAERVALLLRFSDPQPKDVDNWIDHIISSQMSDGNWKIASIVQTYEGQSGVLTPPASHTTALALLALRCYLNE